MNIRTWLRATTSSAWPRVAHRGCPGGAHHLRRGAAASADVARGPSLDEDVARCVGRRLDVSGRNLCISGPGAPYPASLADHLAGTTKAFLAADAQVDVSVRQAANSSKGRIMVGLPGRAPHLSRCLRLLVDKNRRRAEMVR